MFFYYFISKLHQTGKQKQPVAKKIQRFKINVTQIREGSLTWAVLYSS